MAVTPLCRPNTALTAHLPDGTVLGLRPLQDGDRASVLDVFARMSDRSRYLRFLSPVPRLSESMLRLLTTLDDRDRVAWAAYDGTRCVAIVRYARWASRPETADLAVAVVDSLHRRGLGRVLLGVLAAAGAPRGIEAFTVTVHPENRASLALLRSFGVHLRLVDGVYEGRLPVAAVLADERVRQQVDLAAVQAAGGARPLTPVAA